VKYLVKVGDTDVEVLLDGDVVEADGKMTTAHLTELEGTPVRLVTIGDAVHRVIARRGATRGRYTVWLDGYRYEVEALDSTTHVVVQSELVANEPVPDGGSDPRAAAAMSSPLVAEQSTAHDRRFRPTAAPCIASPSTVGWAPGSRR